MRIIFVNQGMLDSGGMPDDLRNLAVGAAADADTSVTVITDLARKAKSVDLRDVEVIDAPDIMSVASLPLEQFSKDDRFILVEFSNLYNVLIAERLRKRGLTYVVMPAWQISAFLDYDNPFEKSSIPSMENIAAGKTGGGDAVISRVRSGKLSPAALLQALKRKLYRKTLGRRYLNGAAGIQVFSAHERNQINYLVGPKRPNYQFVHLGAEVENRKSGPDRFPKNGNLNITFWGRVDYFYKGLGDVLDALAKALALAPELGVTFWIVGPDYNNGYEKVRDDVDKFNLSEHVKILEPGSYTPGTIGLLQDSDFCIASSRWDGFSRTLREAACLGVPILTNPETHFDAVIERFGNGIVFNDSDNLADILSRVQTAEVQEVREAATNQKMALIKFFRWQEAGSRLVRNLEEL